MPSQDDADNHRIDAAFRDSLDGTLYLFRGGSYVPCDAATLAPLAPPQSIDESFPGLIGDDDPFSRGVWLDQPVDTVAMGFLLRGYSKFGDPEYGGVAMFFKAGFVRIYDVKHKAIVQASLEILFRGKAKDLWGGIDLAVNATSNGSHGLIFKGKQYYRYQALSPSGNEMLTAHNLDIEGPYSVDQDFPGMWSENVVAAFAGDEQKIYVFEKFGKVDDEGNRQLPRYMVYDLRTRSVEAGYPKRRPGLPEPPRPAVPRPAEEFRHFPAESAFSPLRLIGERRRSTPGPDDQMFLTATVVREDFSKETYNGLKHRTLRDVEIAGPLLRWSGSNRVLGSYYGEQVADIRSLTIYADRMEVADRLRFPRAKVTIHARELAFTGIGCIDTTPLDHAVRAESEYLTDDPEDLTNTRAPADAEGRPTSLAADGARGEPGGSITLHVRHLIDDDGKKTRFICRGGKGQQGEAGGLQAYVAKEGYPEKYGPLNPVTADDVKNFFQEKNCGPDPCWRYRWPGEVDWPDQISVPSPPGNVLNTGQAVAVTVLTYCDDIGPTVATPIAWAERGFLPGREYTHWWNPRGSLGDYNEWPDYEGVPNPAPRPCDGRDAYPGGWPGDGGDGGTVASLLGSAPIAAGTCDLAPGLPGTFSEKAAGGAAPGPTPAYALRIKIVKKSLINSKRGPEAGVTEVTGHNGADAPGRCFEETPGPPDQGAYQTKRSAAQAGQLVNQGKDDLSWAHPAALAAVLSHARIAYRNGFREEAAAALDPYQELASADPATLGSADTRLRLAFASIVAMRNHLVQNLDYYGNPPGWVPRLNALSNLEVLKTVRQAAYGTFYFADKMLSDYDALENARAVSQEASKAIAAEMNEARASLQTAYDRLPDAMRALDAVQQEIVPIELDLVRLRNRAIEKGKEKVMVQRFFSAAFQIAGGIAKALPVGQPFLGLAGSALGSIGEFDWNAEEPLASARSSLDSLSGHVTTFATDQDSRDKVAAAVTSGLRGSGRQGEALVTKLTRQLEDEEKEPAAQQEAAEAAWTDFKTKERSKLDEQIKETLGAVEDLRARVRKRKETGEAEAAAAAAEEREADAGDGFLAQLKKQRAALDEKRLGSLRKGLVEYRKQQAVLEAEARRAAQAVNEKLKRAAARIASSDIPPSVQERLTAASRASEDHKALVDAREETAKTVMSSLEGVGSGLSMVGNSVISLISPLSSDDPTVTRLAEQMLVEDPELRAAGREMNAKLMALLERKKQAVTELVYWQQKATASTATVTSGLATMTELSRQRQSLDQGLDPSVQGYLRETRERAKDALAESIYWFVKSYQYEFLTDVEDSFYNFDSWSEKLRSLEKTKQQETLSKEDFEAIGDEIFKAEQLKLGQKLLASRQQRGKKYLGTYQSCILERQANPRNDAERRVNQMLDSLAEGQATFNFINDFQKGSTDLNDARVVKVELTGLDLEATDRNLSLTIRVEQSGDTVIAQKTPDEGRVFYTFRPGRHADPVSWQYVYNHAAKKTASGLTESTMEDPIADNVRALLDSNLPEFQEYSPGLLSDYTIRFTDLLDGTGTKKGLKAVNRVEMRVTLSSA